MTVRKYTTTEHAILTTLLYSDIFSFPPTKGELWKFLIAEKKISRKEFDKNLNSLKKFITYQKGYYCLSGRKEIIAMRIRNIYELEKKMQRAYWIAKKLSHIPSILFIGLSGGLAVGNVRKDDDIDVVIIVRKNTLFVSRLCILILLQFFGVRRSRNQKNAADTVCVNLLFDESVFSWFGAHQDIYTAREIAQMTLLFDKNNTYQKFLSFNKWIKFFLPNALSSKVGFNHLGTSQKDSFRNKFFNRVILNSIFETMACRLQMTIMKTHQTNEIVTKHLLAFHPFDYRVKTLRRLRLKMRQIGLLTKI